MTSLKEYDFLKEVDEEDAVEKDIPAPEETPEEEADVPKDDAPAPLIDNRNWNTLVTTIQSIVNKDRKDLVDMSMFLVPVSSTEELDTPFIAMQVGRIAIRRISSSRIQLMNQNRTGSFNIFKKFFTSWNTDASNSVVFVRMRGRYTYVLTFQ